jgi:hypothetical protein
MASGASGQAGKNENAEFIVMDSPLQQRQTIRSGANTGEQVGVSDAHCRNRFAWSALRDFCDRMI